MNLSDKKQQYEIEVKAPIGMIKAIVDITREGENTFHGKTQIMGKECVFEEGQIKEGNNFLFHVTVPLPFGKLELDVNVAVDEEGIILGEGIAPRRKPMCIVGKRVA